MSAIVDQLPSKDNMISELFANRMSASSPQSLPSQALHQSFNDNKQTSILFQKVFPENSSLF